MIYCVLLLSMPCEGCKCSAHVLGTQNQCPHHSPLGDLGLLKLEHGQIWLLMSPHLNQVLSLPSPSIHRGLGPSCLHSFPQPLLTADPDVGPLGSTSHTFAEMHPFLCTLAPTLVQALPSPRDAAPTSTPVPNSPCFSWKPQSGFFKP